MENTISNTKITIDEWHRQNTLLKQDDTPPLNQGFATFFLNRTNRSGILKAGVIGGLNQTGSYKLDCRFNKADLIRRIERIGNVARKIHVTNFDTETWLPMIDNLVPPNSLIYLAPPYYEQGQGLYRNFYRHQDHLNIQKRLDDIKTSWIVSYDNNSNIKEIYQKYRQKEYTLNYSANKKIKATEIVIYRDNLIL
ncbi:MAG: DNA adenine methylase [Pasteurellaceae bacterium]|nr:DNA adenine methylase [Pasteurellaceae bacterium]